MGVRFECPAGHKLHVKAELAGKRGICPECGAKFIVPSFSGERVAEDNGAATNSTVVVSPPPSQGGARGGIQSVANSQSVAAAVNVVTATPPPLTQAPATPAPAPPEPTAWYIRPASGGQFGPANDEVFAQWIAEGRVSADSWVWRNGWADWKAGGEALREYSARMAAEPALAMAAAAAATPPVSAVGAGPAIVTAAPQTTTTVAAAQVDATSAEVRRAEIKRRKQKVRNLSILLGVVALAMLAALIVVLAR
jgi:hypothetical protein